MSIALYRLVTIGGFLITVAGLPPIRPAAIPVPPKRAAALRIETITGDSTAFHVNSTLVIGPTEVLLVDAQYLVKDAKRVADRIAASGKHLKAVVVTHPDDDHYYGVATILERFPGTPVYMSAAAVEEFTAHSIPQFKSIKARLAQAAASQPGRTVTLAPLPDSLIVPQPFPADRLLLDGEEIQLVTDQPGDMLKPLNTFLWIPSIRTAITGDMVFNGVHVWLAASNEASREAWRQGLQRITDLKPLAVVAGHKRSADAPDTPAAIQATAAYLTDFTQARKTAVNADSLMAIMQRKYPGLVGHGILEYAARASFRR